MKKRAGLSGMNEATFVGRLAAFTQVRAAEMRAAGQSPLIVYGDVEERQVDPDTGRYLRCDMRLNDASNRKLVSGEMKRPESPDGRDPRNEVLRMDARNKALARGLPYYFTCNMAEVVLFSLPSRPGEIEREEHAFNLAPIKDSSEVLAWMADIEKGWTGFLDELERRLAVVYAVRPSVTSSDVLVLRQAIHDVADESIARAQRLIAVNPDLPDQIREEALRTFGLAVALDIRYKSQFRQELVQVLRLAAFVVAQKMILHRVLSEVGPLRNPPFKLDDIKIPTESTDPRLVEASIDRAIAQAVHRSQDYETAFLPTPLSDLLFVTPVGDSEVTACHSGAVWNALFEAVQRASWVAISQSLVGYLYEMIVDPVFRHQLGQYYTREDVVDILTTYAIRSASDVILDPASGGGSFARSLYRRKRELGAAHDQTLAEIWTVEISAFAAGLTTIELAAADTSEPAAYPRVVLRDFFDIRPGWLTSIVLPGSTERLKVPASFDAVVGNPPYISYRRQTNQPNVMRALGQLRRAMPLPAFSGKSDAYVWFIAHATSFLKPGGRLSFVVSSAILFTDYGVPLIRFIGRNFKISAVIDSMIERWFVEGDTNTVLLLLEREPDSTLRAENEIRFLRLRQPLARLLPPPDDSARRDELETLVTDLLAASPDQTDPRFQVNLMRQGDDGGLAFTRYDLEGASGDSDEAELETHE